MKKLLWMWLLLLGSAAQAQPNYNFWAKNVDWDGVTPWQAYIIRSQQRMGPNALPLPIQREPRLDSNWHFEMLGEFHSAQGDQTQNAFVYIRMPLAPGRVAFDITWRPREWFQTSEQVRDFRRARGQSGEGSSPGDIWISTIAQLAKQENNAAKLNLTIQVTVKTTAGKNLDNARHTNTPGYVFDWHAGRNWERQGRWLNRWSLFGNAGLLVWQESLARQNDAFIYGLRSELDHGPWRLGLGATGYVGYINNGDRPYAARADLRYQRGNWHGLLGYQHAFQDLTTHLLRLGVCVQLR